VSIITATPWQGHTSRCVYIGSLWRDWKNVIIIENERWMLQHNLRLHARTNSALKEERKTLKQLLPKAESELTTVRTLFSAEEYLEKNDMSSFVELMNEYAFRENSKLMETDLKFDETSVIKMLYIALRAQKIKCQVHLEMVKGADKMADDIDLYITMRDPAKMNYIIEMKYKKNAVEAILQLMAYVIKNIVPLRNAIERVTNFYLVGMNVKSRDDDEPEQKQEIVDWICIPYRKNKIIVSEMTASDPSFSGSKLKEKFDTKFLY
jgi:hypothetical protein